MIKVVITGSASGLGKAIHDEMFSYSDGEENIFVPIGIDRNSAPSVDIRGDVGIKSDCMAMVQEAHMSFGHIDILINCAGVNHLSPIAELKETDLSRVLHCNLYSILFMTQACLPDLKKFKGTIVNIVSNASHMPMTHSWAYNASKGAADIVTRQMARELTKEYGITVFGISPNKLSGTQMSSYIDDTFPPMRGLSYEQGREYQLKGLLTGEETNPKSIAELLVHILSEGRKHAYLSGCILPMGL